MGLFFENIHIHKSLEYSVEVLKRVDTDDAGAGCT